MSLNVSRALLMVEGLLLLYPTMLGFVLALVPLAALIGRHTFSPWPDIAIGLLIACWLVVGWRMLLVFLVAPASAGRKITRTSWSFAGAGALASLSMLFVANSAWYQTAIYEFPWLFALQPLQLGVLFVPTLLHLAAEAHFRAANKTMEPTR